MFLKMRPVAGEAIIAYAARLREKTYNCKFGDTFDDRILEHMIQTIEKSTPYTEKYSRKDGNCHSFY